jgi:hypothetical protein
MMNPYSLLEIYPNSGWTDWFFSSTQGKISLSTLKTRAYMDSNSQGFGKIADVG